MKYDLSGDLNKENLKELSKKTGNACVGFNLRRTSRLLLRLYDKAYKPIGLKGTQFSLLMAVAGIKDVTIGELSKPLGMERSTLSRNIVILQKKGLVTVEEGEDRRQQKIRITDKGISVLQEALPLWEGVQESITRQMGEGWKNIFLVDLRNLSEWLTEKQL